MKSANWRGYKPGAAADWMICLDRCCTGRLVGSYERERQGSYCFLPGKRSGLSTAKVLAKIVGDAPEPEASGSWMEPSLPLIFAAWHDAPAMAKMLRLAEHIEWADKQGALEVAAGFLRSLREEDWYHLGE